MIANRGIIGRTLNLATGKSIGRGVQIKNVSVPTVLDHEILIKVYAVALNPIDCKYIDVLSPHDSIIGCDYSGQVVSVGKQALGGWKVGDRAAGFVHGGQYPDRGSFAEYLKVDGDLAWHVPEAVSYEDASTYGVTAVTAMLALTVHLDIPFRDLATANDSPPLGSGSRGTILIYSGSTAVGLCAIQMAKSAGYTVVTTASPHSFELVRRYGADSVFDYRSKTALRDILLNFPTVSKCIDCISEGASTEFCAQVLQKSGGKVVTLLDQGKSKIEGVRFEFIMVFSAFNQAFQMLAPIGPKFPASALGRVALVEFYTALPHLVDHIKPPPTRVTKGGFDSVLEGLEELRGKKVSGQKLVIRFA
jgi:NADPH:quinone reductase-like Zn-dependent oxidoreductase